GALAQPAHERILLDRRTDPGSPEAGAGLLVERREVFALAEIPDRVHAAVGDRDGGDASSDAVNLPSQRRSRLGPGFQETRFRREVVAGGSPPLRPFSGRAARLTPARTLLGEAEESAGREDKKDSEEVAHEFASVRSGTRRQAAPGLRC